MLPADDPPPNATRWPRFRSRRNRVVLGMVLLLAVFIAAFDWTWFRPLIQHHIQERSGRRIDFDELHIGLNASLQPTFRLRNLLIQNATWAASDRPLVRAGEAAFTLSWQSLRGAPTWVTRLDLVDADIDLERQADGLRNWRITRPDDRGPGRVRVQSIEARNTRLHWIDRGQGFELDLQVAVIDAPVTLPAHAALPLVRSITLHGTRDGTPFDAQMAVSGLPTFFDTGRAFAMRGALQAGPAQAKLEGTLTDLMQLARADIGLQVTGSRMAELGAVAGLAGAARLPALPTEASAQLVKDGAHWAVSGLQARVGRSDLAGSAEYIGKPPAEGRSTVRATLASERIDFAGLRAAEAGASAPAGSGAVDKVRGEKGKLDADVDLKIGALEGALPIPLSEISAHATVRADRSALEGIRFKVAGGSGSGEASLDTARAPDAVAFDLQLQGLQLAQLSRAAGREAAGGLSGGLNARLTLNARGEALGDLASTAAGTATAELVRASIPDALDAKLALDGGHLLRSVFGAGPERAAVTCSALDLRFAQGRGEVRRLAFATGSVDVTGAGWIDLGRRSIDLVLTPHRKQAALLALDRSMRVSGPLKGPKLALVPLDKAAAPGAPCAPAAAQ